MTSILHKLRAKFLSPNSNLELRLRTLYHRFSATRLGFSLQDWRSKRSYKKWRVQQEALEPPEIKNLAFQPRVSFLLNCSSGDNAEVKTTIHSIQDLSCKNWEILLFFIGEINSDSLLFNTQKDERIKYIDREQDLEHHLTGDFLVFIAPGDRFSKHLLAYFYQAINHHPAADVVYYDCEYTPDGGTAKLPFFKPDSLSPELLFSVNYLSRAFIKRNSVNLQVIRLQDGIGLLAAEYEMILRLVEANGSIEHISKVLISQERLPNAADPDSIQAILSHLSRIGRHQPESEMVGNRVWFSWEIDDPSVAIIIPTKNHPALLKNLVTSILEKTEYHNYSINIVDNESDNEEVLAYYETLKQKQLCSIIPYREKFNYSTALNLGVENTKSDLVLFLNDDMEVIDPHWLTELSQWAVLPEIGVVGARLLRANSTLQHAGIIIGLNGFAGHIYLNAPEHYSGIFGSTDWYRDYLAVTGACQMVRRDLFASVGGYDRDFCLAFGDIDFCLRIHKNGYRNVYTPFANLYHYEGRSRGFITPVEDIQRGYQKLEEFLSIADPYFSPNLTYSRIPCCNLDAVKDSRLQQIEERKKFYLLNS